MTSCAARPASPLNTPGANVDPFGGPYTTGSQTSRTRGSAAAFAATSGPIPAGSPTVMATRGFIDLWLATCDVRRHAWQLPHAPDPQLPQPPAPQPPAPQPDGLSQPPSLPHPPCCAPFAFGSS